MGVVVRSSRYIDFLILLIPTPLVSVLFYSSIPTFCSLKKCFFVLVPVLFCNKILCINFFSSSSINTHRGDYGRPTVAIIMKAAHNVLYTKKHIHTYVSYPAMDISCITSRSVV